MNLNSIIFPAPPEDKKKELYINKNKFIFIPKKDENGNKFHIPCYVQSSQKKIDSNKYLFYFHGNAEDIFSIRRNLDTVRNYLPFNIVAIEYPGYSIYFGEKSSKTIERDSLIVFDYFVHILGVLPSDIYISGRSIGSGPATYLSAHRSPGATILISPFTSIKQTAKSLVGYLNVLVADRFSNIDIIDEVTCPIFFIHGQQDTLVPYSHSIQLSKKCKSPYELLLPDDLDHNNFDFIDFIHDLTKFFKRHNLLNFSSNKVSNFSSELYEVPDYFSKLQSQSDFLTSLLFKFFKI